MTQHVHLIGKIQNIEMQLQVGIEPNGLRIGTESLFLIPIINITRIGNDTVQSEFEKADAQAIADYVNNSDNFQTVIKIVTD